MALLATLRTGLSREAAVAKLGIRARDIEATGKRFAEQVVEAEAVGDALIEATLLDRGMAGDAACLKMAIERRDRGRKVDGEPETLAELFRSMSAPARDEVQAVVERAIARHAVQGAAALSDGAPEPASASHSAAPVAGHSEPSPAPLADPAAPVAAEPVYPCGHPMYPPEGGWDTPADCPRCWAPAPPDRNRGPVVAPASFNPLNRLN